MKLELSSNLLRVINCGQYGDSVLQLPDEALCTDENQKIWDNYIIDIYKKHILEALKEFNEDITICEDSLQYQHPKAYNFATDEIYFDINIPEESFITLAWSYMMNHEKFIDFIKENYSHRDGFMSFMPNDKHSFFVACFKDKERAFAAMFNYRYSDTKESRKIQDDFYEEVWTDLYSVGLELDPEYDEEN